MLVPQFQALIINHHLIAQQPKAASGILRLLRISSPTPKGGGTIIFRSKIGGANLATHKKFRAPKIRLRIKNEKISKRKSFTILRFLVQENRKKHTKSNILKKSPTPPHGPLFQAILGALKGLVNFSIFHTKPIEKHQTALRAGWGSLFGSKEGKIPKKVTFKPKKEEKRVK